MFHMKTKIWDLIKVAETYTLASAGFRSDQCQNEKIFLENSNIPNFLLTET